MPDPLGALVRQVELAGVLAAAAGAGLLPLLAEGRPLPGDAQTGLLLEALAAHGVVTGDPPRLAAPWSGLVDAPVVPAAAQLDGALVGAWQTALALRPGGGDYWLAGPAERLALARAVAPDPRDDRALGIARRLLADLPDVHAALRAGGRVLELGCGLAHALTGLLLVEPAARAVGVELAADLVAVARATADELGVGDRLELVVGDAAAVPLPDSAFALCRWSQFFFPAPSREAALRQALRALAPGGVLQAPVLPRPEDLDDDADRQEAAAQRLLVSTWGVPLPTPEELAAELTAAGFAEAAVVPAGGFALVRARRPG